MCLFVCVCVCVCVCMYGQIVSFNKRKRAQQAKSLSALKDQKNVQGATPPQITQVILCLLISRTPAPTLFLCIQPLHTYINKNAHVYKQKRVYILQKKSMLLMVSYLPEIKRHIGKELNAVHHLPDIKNLVKAVRKFILRVFWVFVFN